MYNMPTFILFRRFSVQKDLILKYNILNTNSKRIFRRLYSEAEKETKRTTGNKTNSIVHSASSESTSLQTSVKNIKETVATVSYTGVAIVGLGVCAVVIYAIFSELFSSKSANSVYSKAFKYVANDPRITDAIGDSIKGYGEESRRGRRQHISHALYTKDGVNRLRMKFYIKGSRGSGTVHLEMMENEKGKYVYRYLFAIIDGVYQKLITLEDNRANEEAIKSNATSASNFKELDLSEAINLTK